ncbi:MAG: ATPase V [Spirochaetaceae bacterium]|nr:ATPase V [Spirochaetaceae bacterium]
MDYFFIGDPELVTAFRFVGVDGISVVNADEANTAFEQATRGSGGEICQILIMTEEVADWLGDTLTEWQLSDHYPLIVELPGLTGRLLGRKTLVDSIREAIGIHV